MLNSSPLNRLLVSIVILIPKDHGQPKIQLRINNTYEADYNLVLKYFWPKQGMKKAEKYKWLGLNQTGGRKNINAVETATINELVVEYHRLTRQALCIYQDDAMGCYDQIIRGHATWSSRKCFIPDNICKVHSIAHNKIKFKTQINNKISSIEYTHTEGLPIHGIEQGAGNRGTKWNFISVPMMKIVEEIAPGCKLRLPKGDKEWNKHIVGVIYS